MATQIVPVFSLGGPAGGDYGYAYKPGGVDYFRGSTPITNKQYNAAQSVAGTGPRAEVIEASAPDVLGAATVAPADPNGTKSTAPAKADKSNDIALQLAGLGAVDSQTNAGLGSIDSALGKLTGQYDTEAGTNEKTYTDNSNTNQGNLQKNKQTSLVNAAQGRQGLYGTLASLGALSGTGLDLANRAVVKGANDDLAGAAENFSTNQGALDTSIGTFRQEDKMRRDNALTAAENARTNVRGDAAKNRMSFFSNLANDYAAMGDEGNAKAYTSRAAELYPEMARANVPNSNIAYTGAAFTAPTLASYMAGADSTQVSATPIQAGSSIPGLIAAPTKKKVLQPA